MRKPENYYNDNECYIDKIESAWAKAALHLRTGNHFGHAEGSERARGLLTIYGQLEVYRRRFENGGDTLALLQAVSTCAEENLPLPSWLAVSYQAALSKFLRPEGFTSLDAVFYSPYLPTSTPSKTTEAQHDWQLGCQVYGAVWDIVLAETGITSIDGALTAVLKRGVSKVGGRNHAFNIGKTKARALLSMVEKCHLEFIGEDQALSRFLEKRRKR